MIRSHNGGAAPERRFEQAAEWYLRLRGDLSTEEFLEWDQWYSDPANQEALELIRRVSPLHRKLKRPELLSAKIVEADEYDGAVPVSEWVGRALEPATTKRKWGVSAGALRALAAGFVGIAIVGTQLIAGRWWADSPEPLRIFETRAGQHQDVTLSDGSQITLGARTKLSAHYSADRRIVLLEEGEALFSVAKNKARPFTVVAAGGTVTAVGTRFNVRSDLDRVTVTVTEGAVDVAPAISETSSPAASNDIQLAPVRRAQWQPARVVKGQEVTYDESQGRGLVANAEPGATEWLSGRLQYRQVPLKYVAADVQRYFNKSIVLTDHAAGEFEFTGTIFPAEVDDWFRALETIFPVQVTQADEHILIKSRSAEPSAPLATPQ